MISVGGGAAGRGGGELPVAGAFPNRYAIGSADSRDVTGRNSFAGLNVAAHNKFG
jgi:hypothetical protein